MVPNGTGCYQALITWDIYIGFRKTGYKSPQTVTMNGESLCRYTALACAPGTNATCIPGEEVIEPVPYTTCPAYWFAIWVIRYETYNGTTYGWSCWTSIGVPWYRPVNCT